MGLLTSMIKIDLSNNTDTLLSEIGECVELQVLNLFGNIFAGKLPDLFYRLSNLNQLFLGSNMLGSDISQIKIFMNLGKYSVHLYLF